MACCGGKRAQLNTRASRENDRTNAPAPVAYVPPRPTEASKVPFVPLRYLQHGGLSLRGPHTGTVYHVSGAAPDLAVHPDDAAALLRTGLFAQPGG
jgi:hypothetical protein